MMVEYLVSFFNDLISAMYSVDLPDIFWKLFFKTRNHAEDLNDRCTFGNYHLVWEGAPKVVLVAVVG